MEDVNSAQAPASFLFVCMGAADNENLLSFIGVASRAGIGEEDDARRDRGCAASAKGDGVFATTSLLEG